VHDLDRLKINVERNACKLTEKKNDNDYLKIQNEKHIKFLMYSNRVSSSDKPETLLKIKSFV
jgi:hypothetical protein